MKRSWFNNNKINHNLQHTVGSDNNTDVTIGSTVVASISTGCTKIGWLLFSSPSCTCWLFNVLMRCAMELRIGLMGVIFGLDNCDAAEFCVKIALAVSTRLPINSFASRLRCWRISSAVVFTVRTGLGGFNGFGALWHEREMFNLTETETKRIQRTF